MASRFPPRPTPFDTATGSSARSPGGAADGSGESVPSFECDACGKVVEGEPSGHGLYVWTRGDEVRYEEPPLCTRCANAIGLVALAQWELEEDGE